MESVEKVTEEWAGELKALFVESKNEIKPPMTIMLTAWSHDDCFANILTKSYPGVKVLILSVDDFLKDVTFELSAEKMRLAALHTIAIHTLFA
jgi:hypothetical protein